MFDADIVCYVAMVVSLIEGRRVSEREIREMLARAVRQHRMARRRRIDYVLHYLENNSS
jgi:F420-0:gamma-glutamyl ligase